MSYEQWAESEIVKVSRSRINRTKEWLWLALTSNEPVCSPAEVLVALAEVTEAVEAVAGFRMGGRIQGADDGAQN